MAGNKKLGRAVLTARVLPTTTFDINKKSVQCNLASLDASGKSVFARYNIPLESPAKVASVRWGVAGLGGVRVGGGLPCQCGGGVAGLGGVRVGGGLPCPVEAPQSMHACAEVSYAPVHGARGVSVR